METCIRITMEPAVLFIRVLLRWQKVSSSFGSSYQTAHPNIPEDYNLIAYCNEKFIFCKSVYSAFQRTPAALFLNLFLSTYPTVTDWNITYTLSMTSSFFVPNCVFYKHGVRQRLFLFEQTLLFSMYRKSCAKESCQDVFRSFRPVFDSA